MPEAAAGVRAGPLELAPGVSRFKLFSYLYAAFICIGILAGMNFLQPYVLTENLAIPRGEQGTVSGNLVDSIGPLAPFIMVGVIQCGLCLLAVVVRVVSPGSGALSGRKVLQAAAEGENG